MQKRPSVALLVGLTQLLPVAASAETQIRDVFERVNPAVVVVHTVERRALAKGRIGEVSLPALGSGVLISDDGLIMTAAHVVHTADQIEVEFINDERMFAEIVASDPATDLALLRIERMPKTIKPAILGDSDKQAIGDRVLVIGTPYGISHSLSVGHISGRHRNEPTPSGAESMMVNAELFQTDAAINKGNSGGPMFNMDGEVIGIVSHILSQSGGFEGLGFAVASNTARVILIEKRVFWNGISGVVVTGPLARALNIPEPAGYLVQKVARGSPGERLGLHPSRFPVIIDGRPVFIGGDIILAVGGVQIGNPTSRLEIQKLLSTLRVGDKVDVLILREGRRQQLTYYQVD